MTVKELAEKLNRKSKDVIAKLIARGVLATINQPLDPSMAIDVAKEFGSDGHDHHLRGRGPAGRRRAAPAPRPKSADAEPAGDLRARGRRSSP